MGFSRRCAEECEIETSGVRARGTGNRGQIEKWERADRVNKHSREVLSPCTGRGSVCMCVCVYKAQLAPIWTGMSLHLSEACACFALKTSVLSLCAHVCVHAPVLKTASLEDRMSFEHIKKTSQTYIYRVSVLLRVHFKRDVPVHMHTMQRYADFRFHKRSRRPQNSHEGLDLTVSRWTSAHTTHGPNLALLKSAKLLF